MTALGALVVIIIVIFVIKSTAGGSSSNDAGSSGGGATTSANGKTAAGIGTPVRDGEFEFTVTAVDPGKSTIGTGSISKTAQGQFVLVHVTVRNIGNQQYFDQSSQKMIDQQGRQLSRLIANEGVVGV